jgi:transcriptional regulator with XRE-family HTH domain
VIDSEWQWIDADARAAGERPVIEDVNVAPAETVRAATLGEVLRAERERQGLGLDQIEEATRIRTAQLRAIEEDRLDALPAEAYARAFVRDYADELGMDADATVGLFNEQWSRTHTTASEPAPVIRPPLAAAARRPLGVASVGLALVLLLVSAALFLTRGSGHASPAAQPPPTSHATSSASTNPPSSTTTPPPAAPVVSHLTVTAATGACWIEARRGSATGPLLAERTLAQGEGIRLRGQHIWLRLGDPANVQLRLNGQPLALAASVDPINVMVSRRGLRAA